MAQQNLHRGKVRTGIFLAIAVTVAGCDELNINSLDEFRNNVVGKQYTSSEVVGSVSVNGVQYPISKRDYKDLRSGAESETGTDYTVMVAGSVVPCGAAAGLAGCKQVFLDKIPERIETQRRAEAGGDMY